MDAGEGSSRGDKGKGKAPLEGKKKKAGEKRVKTKKESSNWKREDGKKWNPGDPLPEYPTASQIDAHNKFVVERFFQTARREEGMDFTQDPAYQVMLNSYMLPPEEEVPEGAEARWMTGDFDYPPNSSSDSSHNSSEESSKDESD